MNPVRALVLVLLTALTACDERSAPRPESTVEALAPLDLNRATTAELERLPGIGDKLARSIIASRNARGGRFNSVEELLQIDGIGEKTLTKIKAYLYVTPRP